VILVKNIARRRAHRQAAIRVNDGAEKAAGASNALFGFGSTEKTE
jgi:hypothetical protein